MKMIRRSTRMLPLVLAAAMLLAALPALAAKATTVTPEDVYNRWYELEGKWLNALADSRFDDGKVDQTISNIIANNLVGDQLTWATMLAAGIATDVAGGKEDDRHELSPGQTEDVVVKEGSMYTIALKHDEAEITVEFDEATGAFHCAAQVVTEAGNSAIYTDIIPTKGGMYTSLVIAEEGAKPLSITQYMRDSLVYIVHTELPAKADPADYVLLEAPEQFEKLKREGSAAFMFTESGKLTVDVKDQKEHFQSK